METIRICPSCQKPLPPDVPMGLCPECLVKQGFPSGSAPGTPGTGTGTTETAGFLPPPVEQIAQLFPRLEILGLLGRGGMGAVYKARQPELDRLVALKILPPALAAGAGFTERFNREARALARLNHPNIVAVYDFGRAGTLPYLMMEFVDGSNLREVERAGRLTPQQAVAIIPQICEALQFAHNEGVVHRDIKPENILIDKRGRVKIADFGIAKMLGVAPGGSVSLTGAQDVMGTPHYMAPEQFEKPQSVDHRADIYSLGVVFYEMLTGELPLGRFAPPSKKVEVDVRLDEIVLRTLEKEPERRYQQASQVRTDVETVSARPGQPLPAMPPTISPATFTSPPAPSDVSDKIILPAFLLALFFGIFGAHRFYVGKIGTAIVQLLTLGGLGIWAIIDCILLVCGAFTDKQGKRLANWVHPGPGAPVPTAANLQSAPLAPGAAMAGSPGYIVAAGVALMVAGGLKIVTSLVAISALSSIGPVLGNFNIDIPFHFVALPAYVALLFKVIPSVLIIYGGYEMMVVRSYPWAVAASVLAIVVCGIVSTPVGIWALVVLLMNETRQVFASRANSRP